MVALKTSPSSTLLEELGMVGVQLACSYGNKFLDDDLFVPMMEALNELDVPVVVHHTPGQNSLGTSRSTRCCAASLAA
jgi:predicted TIM-barrel fold metal-dependent hydrolase